MLSHKKSLYMKKQKTIMKISKLINDIELSRNIRQNIISPYKSPAGGSLDKNKVKDIIDDMKKLNRFEEQDLNDVISLLRDNDISLFSSFFEKNASNDQFLFNKILVESKLKKSYYNNLRRLTDNFSADSIYKKSINNIELEILKTSSSSKELIQKFSILKDELSESEWIISNSAFKLSKADVSKTSGKLAKYMKFLPIIGIIWMLYSVVDNIIDAYSIWDNEYEKYSQYGKPQQLFSPDYIGSLYERNKNNLVAVDDIVNILKISKEFNDNFWESLLMMVDVAETIIVSPLIVSGWGILIELIISYGLYKLGEGAIEERKKEFDFILNEIHNDLLEFEKKSTNNFEDIGQPTARDYNIEDLEF